MQRDWTDHACDACDGYITVFAAYFEPDILDDIEAFTITNVKPHVLNAHTA